MRSLLSPAILMRLKGNGVIDILFRRPVWKLGYRHLSASRVTNAFEVPRNKHFALPEVSLMINCFIEDKFFCQCH